MSVRVVGTLLGALAFAVPAAAAVAAPAAASAAPDAPCPRPTPAAVVTVIAGDDCVAPLTARVAVAEVVVWRSRSGVAHELRGDHLEFDLPARSSYGRTFDRPGTYGYVCRVHPAVRGVVEVTGQAIEFPEPRRLRWPHVREPWAVAALAAVVVPAAWALRSFRE